VFAAKEQKLKIIVYVISNNYFKTVSKPSSISKHCSVRIFSLLIVLAAGTKR
jgi:hypothetical protein